VPGGSVADVLGAVTGIESKLSSMAATCPAPCRKGRLAFSSAHQGVRRSQGAEVRELAGRAGLKGCSIGSRLFLRQRKG
jgi:hypothetical protein